jgi:hypothetical protein
MFSSLIARMERVLGSRKSKSRFTAKVPRGLRMEPLEQRSLLSAAGFVQGFAYNASAQPVAGLSIALYNTTGTYPSATATTPAATTTTNSDGYYQFSNVAPGTYDVVENSALSTVSGANVQTTVNAATQVTSPIGNGAAIQVQVLNLSTTTFSAAQLTNPATPQALDYQLNASATNAVGPFNTTATNGIGVATSLGDNIHQFNLSLTSNSGNLNNIYSFCSDLFDSTFGAGTVWTVNPSLTPNTTTQSADIGALAYLYNNYGNALQSATNGAALQMATWALEYDDPSNTSLTSATANYEVLSDPNNLVPAAQSFIDQALTAQAAGRGEDVYFLNYANSLQAGGTYGYPGQGQLSTDLLNLTVTQPPPIASPKITTTPNITTVSTLPVTLKDTAMLSGGNNPTGSITFTLISPDNTIVDTETVTNVNGNGSYTTPTGYILPSPGALAGSYQWEASYSGDQGNKPASDVGDSAEVVTVPGPAITTKAQTSGCGVVGATYLSDSVTVTGGNSPTGTVSFTLMAPDGTVSPEGSVTIKGDGTYSAPKTVLATEAGVYVWHASYSGDTKNGASSDTGANESVTVGKAGPMICTTPSPTCVTLGANPVSLTDKATLSGGYNPSGSITFTLYAPGGSIVGSPQTVNVSGDGTYTSPAITLPTTGTVVGTYQWVATYNGDNNNNPYSDNNNNAGCQSSSCLTYQANCGYQYQNNCFSTYQGNCGYSYQGSSCNTYQGNCGSQYQSSCYNTYQCNFGYSCQGSSCNTYQGNCGSQFQSNCFSTYQGNCGYSYQGNSCNTYSGNCGSSCQSYSCNTSEQVTVTAASPAIATTPSPTCVTLGSSTTPVTLTDTAVLSGGYYPTGTLTFVLYDGSTQVYTYTVSNVSGNGSYTTPGYVLPTTGTVVGTYQWVATYSGDANNSSASDKNTQNNSCNTYQGCWGYSYQNYGCNTYQGNYAEQVTVNAASPTITTTPNQPTVVLGKSSISVTLTDTATLSGGYNAGGTITFTLVAPGGCYVVDTETVNVVPGVNSYTTPTGYTLPSTCAATGTYQWNATYSGDGNNNAACDINDCNERVTVSSGSWDVTTCNFWNSSCGKQLLYEVNGGGNCGSATNLGNWLAADLPQLCGSQASSFSSCGKNLAGASNAAVDNFFASLCNANSNYAHDLAEALGTYVTDCNLAGGNYVASCYNAYCSGGGANCYDVNVCGINYYC